MPSNQTTTSGEELTLITGMGGQPATRETIERLCRTKATTQPKQQRARRTA